MMVFMNIFIAMLGIAVVGFAGLAIEKVGDDHEFVEADELGREPGQPAAERRVS